MLNLLFGPPRQRAIAPIDNDALWVGSGIGRVKTSAGTVVDDEIALTYSAVWCATRALVEPAASLPLDIIERKTDDQREIAQDYQLYDIVKTSPNDKMDAMPYWEGRYAHAINWGGGFAEIQRERDNPEARPIALHPIHASRVTPCSRADRDRGYVYHVRNDDGSVSLLRSYEMFHIPGVLSDDGIWGRSVIPYARESIGFGLSTEKHGATFFGGGAQPQGIITGLVIKDPAARKNFREEWKAFFGHPGSKEIAILPPNADYKTITIPNEASQFLQTRQHNVREIARWYKLPVHMLMDSESAQGMEITAMQFVMHNLWPWLHRTTGQVRLKLIPKADQSRYYAEYNMAGLVRGVLKERMESYRLAIMMGVMTINEARKLENRPGIGPAGDEHYVPLNMTTAERMANGEPPPGSKGLGSDQSGAQGDMEDYSPPSMKQSDKAAIAQHLKRLEKELEHRPEHNGNGAQLRKATRALAVAAFSRVYTKETLAAKRAAAREKFEDWSSDFYAKHRATMTKELEPVIGLINSIGITVTADSVVMSSIAESKERISAALSQSPATLLGVLDSWPTDRAEKAADEILGEA